VKNAGGECVNTTGAKCFLILDAVPTISKYKIEIEEIKVFRLNFLSSSFKTCSTQVPVRTIFLEIVPSTKYFHF
jgi:hypothetical protein